MPLTAAIGKSKHPNAASAAQEAVQSALTTMAGTPPLFALVFASVQYDQQLLIQSIHSLLPQNARLVGCSDAGEISSSGPDRKSVVILLLGGEGIRVATTLAQFASKDPLDSCRQIAQSIQQQLGASPKALIVLADGLSIDGVRLAAGFKSVFTSSFPFTGVFAGDDFFFRKTYQYYDGGVYTNSVIAIGIDGPIAVGIGARHGWKNLGIPHIATKVRGNQLLEIDGKPAIRIYEECFGKENADLLYRQSLGRLAIVYPLGVRIDQSDSWLLRNALAVDSHGVITTSGTVPQGAEIQLMIGGKLEAMRASQEAATEALSQLGYGLPKVAINFSSVARSRLLGAHAVEEINAIRQATGTNIPFVGCYGYGELEPMMVNGSPQTVFQNASTAIMLIGD